MVKTEWITLAAEDGRRFDAYHACPAEGRAPAILLLHDMFGVTPPFRTLAEDYAKQGHAVLVPNQFWRSDPSGELPYEGGHERGWARITAFDFDGAIEGMRLAIETLRRAPNGNGKVLALGFCFSGVLAYIAAARTDIDAAIAFYALGISRYLGEAARIAIPVQLHYGLADESVPQAEIDTVAQGVAGMETVELYRYPGAGHSFFNPVRPMYDASAAALAARRIDALLTRIA